MSYEVPLVELEFLLESYLSHVSIYGDLCAISFAGGFFLVVTYASTCLSSHAFLEDSLLHSGSMFHPFGHDFGVMNKATIESIVFGFGLDGTLFDILHVNPLAFEKSNSIKEALEQIFKDFGIEHLYYQAPFKEWFSKLFILYANFQKESSAIILKHEFEDTMSIHLIFKEFFYKIVLNEESGPFLNFRNFKSTFLYLLWEIMNIETHQGHVFHLDGKTDVKSIKYIHSKYHDVVHANNKKYGMQCLVFDPGEKNTSTIDDSPDPIIAGRPLDGNSFVDNTLPHLGFEALVSSRFFLSNLGKSFASQCWVYEA
ncbi:hypothetical protein M9H77_02411 [Catharanthus roseus]|uniref:Uncharacterized protein n=1 Tax=Catharanthus roseus TaxID=4058 RepID=A0ACC0C8A0_CATRO|nr:hypothetical protein M9H77_02411 [Catharanthus roseus]